MSVLSCIGINNIRQALACFFESELVRSKKINDSADNTNNPRGKFRFAV